MKNPKLIYVGIKGSVVALDRETGQPVWTSRLKGYDFVNLVIEEGKIYAASYGEIFCLDPVSGKTLWHNRLKGYGTGLAAIATNDTPAEGATAVVAEKSRRDQEAAASGAAVSSAAA